MSDRTSSEFSRTTQQRENTAIAIATERLPWHPAIEQRFGVDRASWRALVEAVFPAAKTVEGVVLALSYCRARKLDPMKRPVHVVPIWDSKKKAYVETVWPGIGELRTTAMRTGAYAGCDESQFGPDKTREFVGTTGDGDRQRSYNFSVTYPEWAQMTVHRIVTGGAVVAIPGPRVYWEETYATRGRSTLPNDMWQKRPRGQIEKCAEAAALRRAFPEELGGEITIDEVAAEPAPGVVIEHVDEGDTPAPVAGASNQQEQPERSAAAGPSPSHAAQVKREPAPPREAAPTTAAEPAKKAEPAPAPQDEAEYWPSDEFGEPAEVGGEPVVTRGAKAFAIWFAARAAKLTTEEAVTALREHNADTIADVGADPKALAIITAAVEDARGRGAPAEAEAEVEPEATDAPDPMFVAVPKTPKGADHWPNYVAECVSALAALGTEAEIDRWIAANEPTYQGKSPERRVQGAIQDRRAAILSPADEAPPAEEGDPGPGAPEGATAAPADSGQAAVDEAFVTRCLRDLADIVTASLMATWLRSVKGRVLELQARNIGAYTRIETAVQDRKRRIGMA